MTPYKYIDKKHAARVLGQISLLGYTLDTIWYVTGELSSTFPPERPLTIGPCLAEYEWVFSKAVGENYYILRVKVDSEGTGQYADASLQLLSATGLRLLASSKHAVGPRARFEITGISDAQIKHLPVYERLLADQVDCSRILCAAFNQRIKNDK